MNDAARGGDIDLLITVHEPLYWPALLALRHGARLRMALGKQHFDIVLEAPKLPASPIQRLTHTHGVAL